MTKAKTKKGNSSSSANLEWCNRVLVSSPVFYSLCTSESSFRRGLKKLGVENPQPWLNAGDCGRVHEFAHQDDGMALVVCIRPTSDTKELIATLVHESVHVWQFTKEYIGEREPSREFEAYSIENIFTTLKDAYDRQTGKNKKNGTVTKRK